MRLAVPALIVFLSALSYHVHLTNGRKNISASAEPCLAVGRTPSTSPFTDDHIP